MSASLPSTSVTCSADHPHTTFTGSFDYPSTFVSNQADHLQATVTSSDDHLPAIWNKFSNNLLAIVTSSADHSPTTVTRSISQSHGISHFYHFTGNTRLALDHLSGKLWAWNLSAKRNTIKNANLEHQQCQSTRWPGWTKSFSEHLRTEGWLADLLELWED